MMRRDYQRCSDGVRLDDEGLAKDVSMGKVVESIRIAEGRFF